MASSFTKYLPHKSYNTFGYLFLLMYTMFGFVIIGIASHIESQATLKCDQHKNFDWVIISNAATSSNIETHCLIQYRYKFYPYSLPLHFLLIINFGIVLLFSIIYACLVKRRVESFVDPSNTTENSNEDESQTQPLLGVSQAATDPKAYQYSGGYAVFMIYVLHLLLCRLAPLTGFAAMLFTSMDFPEQFQCHWLSKTTGISVKNFTQQQRTINSTIDCTYPMGDESEEVAMAFIAVSFLFDAVAFMELGYLLCSTCNDRNFCTDIEFCCVYLLRKRKSIRELIRNIRENISDETFYLDDDFGGKRCSCRRLEDIYVNVMIQEGRALCTWHKGLQNRHKIYEAQFTTPLVNTTTLRETADLFEPTLKKCPRTILVVGRPGIGKTLLTQNIFYQWKRQVSRFWHGKIVILIRFRTFNKGETSLREMLRHSKGFNMSSADFNSFYEYVCLIPKNVILIFDGLDELNITDEWLTESNTVDSHNDVTHILVIFKQLVKGELLPGVKVLITSRPTAERIYEDLKFDREVEILGFHKEQIEKYVETFCCNDTNESAKMWSFISDSPELLSLCYLPVNSYIVCLTLKESIARDEQEAEGMRNVPRTITELYKRAIKILLYRHHLEYKNKKIPKDYVIAKLPERLQSELNKLKRIAKEGIENDKMTFEFETGDDLLAELSDSGLFNKLEDKRRNILCFLHLTIQEFLAALHLVDDMENVESFLSKHIDNPKWYLVIQFLAGLIGDKIRYLKEEKKRSYSKSSKEIVNDAERGAIKRICKRFQDWMPKPEEGRIFCSEKTLLVIKCVHEMQQVRVMKRIATFASEEEGSDGTHKEVFLDQLEISPVESTALFQFLSYIMNLHKLEITRCRASYFAFRELAKLLFSKNDITTLVLRNVGMTDQDAKHIIDTLRGENCKVTKLDMGANILTDESVRCLSDVLMTSNNKLTELDISQNELTDESATFFSNALRNKECKLTELNINHNKLTQTGDGNLREARKDVNGKRELKIVLTAPKIDDLEISDLSLSTRC